MEIVDTNFFSEEENHEESNEGAQRSGVFAELKLYCLQLLELLQKPKKHSTSLHPMLELLRKTSSTSLQPCFDYALFPLLLLLDAAVVDRSQQKVDSGENIMMSVRHDLPHKLSDSVAEGVLQCLEELLKKCHLGSVDQMVVVLKKLTCGALLSPIEASEEFREGVIKCFKAIFMNLRPCSDDACCKQISGSPALAENREFQGQLDVLSEESKPNDCLLEFLRSETASAAVGHWLSLLLKAADIEAARGHHGSSKLRIEAFRTLRILVAKVGTSDALAFFLPGVVSQFSKVLRACKTSLSGAAGNTEATNQAIRGLAEYLMIVLEDDANKSSLDMLMDFQSEIMLEKGKKAQYILEELRQLPDKFQGGSIKVEESSSAEVVKKITYKSGSKDTMSADYLKGNTSFHVNRTKEWVTETSTHVDKLLSATFPYICLHLVKKVRLGVLAAIKGLLSRCSYTLKESRMMLLECLFALAIDDSDDVSFTAQEFLEYLFWITRNHQLQHDIAKIFARLVEKLPNVVLGSDEKFALSHARQLLVVAYYSGPQLIIDHLIHSPVTAIRFLDVFAVCLNQNSVYASSLGKFLSARPSSLGYLHSLTELKVGTNFISNCLSIMNTTSPAVPELTMVQEKDIQKNDHVLPRMPPWLKGVGSQKLYEALGGVLRLVGLSLVSDSKGEGNLSVTIDIPLGNLQKLVSEIRKKEYSEESWEYWYRRTGSGLLVRQASTAVCILNEMIFGVSEYAVDYFSSTFQRAKMPRKVTNDYEYDATNKSSWKISLDKVRAQLIDCIGRILHEYLSPEIWDLPIQHKSSPMDPVGEEDISLHFFRDIAMLHQVIIEGIGIFSMCLGNNFSSCGFLHSSLYLLLENLISSNVEVRSTSDTVLHVLSSSSGYPTVRNLVLENADYVIDSICRQLRHLDLNPHVPNVLAAILSYIGIAHEILPLLEEPMHSVSLELEILGRHQHPNLTGSFLKAVAEIARVSKHESGSLPSKAATYLGHVKSIISNEGKQAESDSGKVSRSCYDDDMNISSMESEWENILFKFNDSRRYRRTVGSIAGSCIVTAIPLLASQNQATCLVALDIVEYGVVALAKVEEAYKHEKDTKEAIEETLQSHSFYRLLDTLDVSDEGSDENRLLPAMNKIWPFLVACIQNKNPVAARRCFNVISSSVQICGGDFFTRRFHTDGSHFWKLLTTSPFLRKQNVREEKAVLQLPYRKTSISLEDSVAEVSSLKVQVALLNMIADLSRNRRSASALEVVLKKVSGLAAGVAFSGVVGLREASLNALEGLASIDSDLIWLLVADVYYSMKKDVPKPPTSDFPGVSQLLPPPLSSKGGYLYVLYGGQSYGFDIQISSVEFVFKKLQPSIFT